MLLARLEVISRWLRPLQKLPPSLRWPVCTHVHHQRLNSRPAGVHICVDHNWIINALPPQPLLETAVKNPIHQRSDSGLC